MKAALLVIDMQKAIFDYHPYEEQSVVENVNMLISAARLAGVEAIFVQHGEGPGSDMEQGTRGWELIPEIAPNPGEKIFQKSVPSAFENTGLKAYLDERGVDSLILTGCQTEWCVNATTKAAAALGYHVSVVSDGHSTIDNPEAKASAIIERHNREVWPKLAAVVPAAAVIAKLSAPVVFRTSIEKILMERFAIDEPYYAETIAKYIGEDGRLTMLPAKNKNRTVFHLYLASRFELGKSYTEPEVNEILKRIDPDVATHRRALIDCGLMSRSRDGRAYTRNP